MEIGSNDGIHSQCSLAIHVGITKRLLVDTYSRLYFLVISHTDAEVLVALPQHFRPVVAPGIERTTIVKDDSFYIQFFHYFSNINCFAACASDLPRILPASSSGPCFPP